MTIREVISNIDNQSEEAVIFAKKENGKFLPSSEVVVVELTDEEQETPLEELAEKYCPGFDYFLEVYLVKDLVGALSNTVGYNSLQQQIDRIINYAESDAE
ncbi:hypothetical protein [Flavisolibacter tropicus]|uniref:DUF7716 domain-containing protein n=1 Tax=Flavisolibacter tropicus TaxID=1492898 RepID=A0A172TVU3_9BACT|nr:hypothetical protein [Flavisolibacter tropicus]ANE51004.1 hypothetical protein SY85_11315 [Flavisolibacter tropicus]